MDSENSLNQDNAMNKNEVSFNTDQTNTETSENMAVVNESNGWVDASPEKTTETGDDIEEPLTKQEDTLGSTEETTDAEQTEVNPSIQSTATTETPEIQQVVVEKKKLSLTPLFALTTVAAVGVLAYTIITNQTQRQQLYHDLSASKEEAKKAQEKVTRLEEASKDEQRIAKETKTTETVIKNAAYDIKFQQLLDLIDRRNYPITSGQIFTNKAGTYLYASLQAGGAAREYYRELPNGDWKYGFGGQMILKCSDFSAEIRKIYHDVERPDGQKNYSCMKGDDIKDTEHL
mgnify:FL=1